MKSALVFRLIIVMVIVLGGWYVGYRMGYHKALKDAFVITEDAINDVTEAAIMGLRTVGEPTLTGDGGWMTEEKYKKIKEGIGMVVIDRNSLEVRSLALELEKQFLIDHMDVECVTYSQEQFMNDAVEILMAREFEKEKH